MSNATEIAKALAPFLDLDEVRGANVSEMIRRIDDASELIMTGKTSSDSEIEALLRTCDELVCDVRRLRSTRERVIDRALAKASEAQKERDEMQHELQRLRHEMATLQRERDEAVAEAARSSDALFPSALCEDEV